MLHGGLPFKEHLSKLTRLLSWVSEWNDDTTTPDKEGKRKSKRELERREVRESDQF